MPAIIMHGDSTYYVDGGRYWKITDWAAVDAIKAAHGPGGLAPLANGGDEFWVTSLAGYGTPAGIYGAPTDSSDGAGGGGTVGVTGAEVEEIVRDAVADLGEGGAAQVRADA